MSDYISDLYDESLSLIAAHKRIAELEKRLDTATEALIRIEQWAEAYPLDIFPEPDNWHKIGEALKKIGSPNLIDNVSASNMRHVVTGIKALALEGQRNER